jgi:hypothetical protein
MSETWLQEIAKDESGAVLWDRPYYFKRLSAAGEYLVEAGVGYTVVSSKVEGNLVLTVLRRATEKLKAAVPAIVQEMQARAHTGCQCPEPRRLFPTGFCRDCGLLVIAGT